MIIGGGVNGTASCSSAKRQGASVIVSETSADRRKAALELGADAVIDPAESDPVEIKQLTNGRGANVVYNTTAIPAVAKQAIDMCARAVLFNMFSLIHPRTDSSQWMILGASAFSGNPGLPVRSVRRYAPLHRR